MDHPPLFFLLLPFLFSVFSLSKQALLLTHPLSLLCYPSSSPNQTINHIQTLLDNLTSGAPTALFTTLNATLGRELYTGLMQCRPGLGPDECARCANAARATIANRCPNSHSISAWFDGCYVQISSNTSKQTVSFNHSCSGRIGFQSMARFGPALETLLLKLRADVNLPTRHGFSHGRISYGANNLTSGEIYGLVECVRLLSPKECDFCIWKAIEKLQGYCSGGNGGVVIDGACLVRFNNSEFYHGKMSSAGGTVTANFSVWEREKDWRRREAVVAYWGGVVGCFAVVVLLAWLLRRAVLNKAKVWVLDFGQTVGKSSAN